MWKLAIVAAALEAALFAEAADGVVIGSFDGTKATALDWEPMNDPVMGGHSDSTFHTFVEDGNNNVGIWSGHVKEVLYVLFPGFCSLRAEAVQGSELPKLSGTAGISVTMSQTIKEKEHGLMDFNMSLSSPGCKDAGGAYVASFSATHNMEEHFVSWDKFECLYRGKPDPECEPLAGELDRLTSVGLIVGGKVGKFSVELESMGAPLSAVLV